MEIFISKSGKISDQVSQALKEILEFEFGDTFQVIDSSSLKKGLGWFTDLSLRLQNLHTGIVVITQENINAPWIYYESGALAKNLDAARLYPYLFDVSVDDLKKNDNPFKEIQVCVADKEGTVELIRNITGQLGPEAQEILVYKNNSSYYSQRERKWKAFENSLNQIREDNCALIELSKTKRIFDENFKDLKSYKQVQENKYMRQLIIDSLNDFPESYSFERHEERYSLPYILYPTHLIRLLKDFNPRTKAIAIVDKDESFWNLSQGIGILESTNEDSLRIFAFLNKEHLQNYIPILNKHSEKYSVYAIDYSKLRGIYGTLPYDFSIIGDINDTSLLGYYEDERSLNKIITFTCNKPKISYHHDLFTSILRESVKVEKTFDDKINIEEITKKIFSPKEAIDIRFALTPLDNKNAEMSSYIPPSEYHKHEEKHAYYVDMMEKMLEIFQLDRIERNLTEKKIRLLELGAGTGIFTKKLLENRDFTLNAIEIDWACYHYLLNTIISIDTFQKDSSQFDPESLAPEEFDKRKAEELRIHEVFSSESSNITVHCLNKDSRTYDPPGKFDYIFSSFADHHIKTLDKAQYFENIRKNLNPGGLVIIGDEFLPPYDKSNSEERNNALRAYHNHIIEETRNKWKNEADGLVDLEMAALESGLKEVGDFKLSCELYEKYVEEAGFNFESELIGPKDRKDVGGIYVYVLRSK